MSRANGFSAAGRRSPRWLLMGLVLLAGGLTWTFGRAGPKPQALGEAPPAPPRKKSVAAASSKEAPGAQPVLAVSLTGGGLTLTEFVEELKKVSALPVQWETPELQRCAGTLRLCEYQGDSALALADAWDLLTFAGMDVGTTEAPGVQLMQRPRGAARLWRLLTADLDPYGAAWGALRCWRVLRCRNQRAFAELLADVNAAPTPAAIEALAWAAGGLDRLVRIGGDGQVTLERSGLPAAAELQAAQELLCRLAAGRPDAADARSRPAVAAALGELLSLTPQAPYTPEHPVLMALGAWAQDADTDTACSALLALGESAAVPAIERLVVCLEDERTGPACRAAALIGLRRAELLGRRLDAAVLGQEAWERRRQLYERVRGWLVSVTSREDPRGWDLALAAAWLRLEAVFPGAPAASECAARLRGRLWESGETPARWVVAALESAKGRPVPDLSPDPIRLAALAGPFWLRHAFTFQQTLESLARTEKPFRQAALWRLNRPEPRRDSALQEDVAPDVALRLAAAAREEISPTLRRLALEALYRERAGAGTPRRYWRMENDPALAAERFLEDGDPGVQCAAGVILGRIAGIHEILQVAQKDLSRRTPEAVECLLKGLVVRWRSEEGQSEVFTSAVRLLLTRVGETGPEALAALARWARIYDPTLSLAAKAHLARSYPTAAERVKAIRSLGESLEGRTPFPAKLAVYLFSDEAAEVRAAIFSSGLAGRVTDSVAERLDLYRRGLADGASQVKVAAVKSLQPFWRDFKSELGAVLEKLAAPDSEPEVRTAASRLLHPEANE